jgi:hypothetical protein
MAEPATRYSCETFNLDVFFNKWKHVDSKDHDDFREMRNECMGSTAEAFKCCTTKSPNYEKKIVCESGVVWDTFMEYYPFYRITEDCVDQNVSTTVNGICSVIFWEQILYRYLPFVESCSVDKSMGRIISRATSLKKITINTDRISVREFLQDVLPFIQSRVRDQIDEISLIAINESVLDFKSINAFIQAFPNVKILGLYLGQWDEEEYALEIDTSKVTILDLELCFFDTVSELVRALRQFNSTVTLKNLETLRFLFENDGIRYNKELVKGMVQFVNKYPTVTKVIDGQTEPNHPNRLSIKLETHLELSRRMVAFCSKPKYNYPPELSSKIWSYLNESPVRGEEEEVDDDEEKDT